MITRANAWTDAGAMWRRRFVASGSIIVLVAIAAVFARGDRDTRVAESAQAVVVDTAAAWSMDSALARFRAGLEPTDTLRHAAPSRDALVATFLAALERADTMALARLHLSRSEFAFLVYPESRYARRPYRQPPEVTWTLIIEGSNSALARLLARRAGAPLRVTGYRCSPVPDAEGTSRYWGECRVRRVTVAGDTVDERLFSSIVERDGRFKIGSYANQF